MSDGPQDAAGPAALDDRWVRQMFAGTIHNIGNVVQVARLTLQELGDQCAPDQQALLDLVLSELLPSLERQAAAGTLQQFVTDDASGREYLGAIRQAVSYERASLNAQYDRVQALTAKLDHISEILLLQQRLLVGIGLAQEVGIAELLDNTRKLMAESCARHRVTVHWPAKVKSQVRVDPSMLTQVLVNLLKNAIEACTGTPARTGEVRLTCHCQERANQPWVGIEVADNGHGLSAEQLTRVGQPGFTTKAQDGAPRGLGLAFCRAALSRHGGSLEIQSPPGQGARFTVWLPAAAPAPRQGGQHGR